VCIKHLLYDHDRKTLWWAPRQPRLQQLAVLCCACCACPACRACLVLVCCGGLCLYNTHCAPRHQRQQQQLLWCWLVVAEPVQQQQQPLCGKSEAVAAQLPSQLRALLVR
jgi:hypothetical protein